MEEVAGVGLIGREQERAELRALVARHRVVFVYGAAGVGKTTLVLDVCRGAARDRVVSEVVYLPIPGTLDVRDVVERTAKAIGAPRPTPAPERVGESLSLLLSGAPRTVVWDDVDERSTSLIEVVKHFAAHDGPARLVLISRRFVTSREASLRTPVYEVKPLSHDDAVRLVRALEAERGRSLAERDEIYFSICYGPDGTGRVAMNFGPLNRQGGERRLNVAVTRARRVLRVFSSLTAADIDLRRTSTTGPSHLKEFLTYVAAHAVSAEGAGDVPRVFTSRFDEEIARVLTERGYVVDTVVGCGAYRLDLAVRHPAKPGVFALAVESDGASYASAESARDRDRLRHDVLAGRRGLGWRLHRVWSTDWWFERDREVHRLTEAIERALVAPDPEPEPEPVAPTSHLDTSADERESGEEGPSTPRAAPSSGRLLEPLASPSSPATPYVRAALAQRSDDPEVLFDTTHRLGIAQAIEEVTRIEGPIHADELCRRVGAAYGVARLSQRMRGRMLAIASQAALTVRGDFLWPHGMDDFLQIRGPGADRFVRPPEALPPEETANAASWVLRENVSMPHGDLVREMSRLFGYERAKSAVAKAMGEGIRFLAEQRGCLIENGTVIYREPAGRRVRAISVAPSRAEGPTAAPVAPPASAPTPRGAPIAAVPSGPHPLALALSQSPAFLASARDGVDRRNQALQAVDFLARRDGHCAPLHALAAALDCQPFRANGLVSVLSEVLNLDGYVVLRNDPANEQVLLEVATMRALFGLVSRPQ